MNQATRIWLQTDPAGRVPYADLCAHGQARPSEGYLEDGHIHAAAE